MKTAQQRIMELKERVNIGVKVSRFLLFMVVISLTVNSVLAVQLHRANAKVNAEANKPTPIIVGTGTMEKIGDNMFQIIEDSELEEQAKLPPLPAHLK